MIVYFNVSKFNPFTFPMYGFSFTDRTHISILVSVDDVLLARITLLCNHTRKEVCTPHANLSPACVGQHFQ